MNTNVFMRKYTQHSNLRLKEELDFPLKITTFAE